MEVTFEQKRKKLQGFYDEWIKPIQKSMSPELLEGMENMIEEYSLVR